jgi:hypothetical protein
LSAFPDQAPSSTSGEQKLGWCCFFLGAWSKKHERSPFLPDLPPFLFDPSLSLLDASTFLLDESPFLLDLPRQLHGGSPFFHDAPPSDRRSA